MKSGFKISTKQLYINNSRIHEKFKLVKFGNKRDGFRMTKDIYGYGLDWECTDEFIWDNFVPLNSKLSRLLYL